MSPYPLILFHDGSCPICRFEVAQLQARNLEQKLQFIDITRPEFDPAVYGRSLTNFNTQIHALCADGRFVQGMEAFRLAYQAVGLGWITAPSGWGHLRKPVDAMYRLFANHRGVIGHYFGWIFEGIVAYQTQSKIARCQKTTCPLPPSDITH